MDTFEWLEIEEITVMLDAGLFLQTKKCTID